MVNRGIPRITFETDRWAQPTEPEHHILSMDGKILLSMEDEEELQAGIFQLLLVSLSTAREDGFAAFEVLDSLTDTAHYLELIDDSGDWSQMVRHQFVDVIDSDLLIVNKVNVDLEYRGRGLGILAVKTAIDCFSRGCGLVALKPFPLQFTHWESPDWEPETPLPDGMTKAQAFRSALKKVEKHWARLGFRRIGRTDLWGLCPAHRQPTLEKALRGIPRTAEAQSLSKSTVGPRLVAGPVGQSGRREKFKSAQRSAHKRYGEAFKKLAE
jgi:hypothetical protein